MKNERFSITEQRIIDKYGKFLRPTERYRKYIVMDIIEAEETMQKLLPILRSFVTGTLPTKKTEKALITLEVHIWHLVDHLNRLSRTLKRDD